MLKLNKNYILKDFEKDFKKIGNQIYSWQVKKINKKFVDKKNFKLSADIIADNLIKFIIKKYFRKSPILSEENKYNKISRNFWLIDPIDGTRSFYNNFKGYVCQACYISNGKPIYSIIYAPALRKIWTARSGFGAFLNGKKMKLVEENLFIKVIDNYSKPTGITKFLMKKIPHSKYLESGSIGLKACLVADGTANLFVKDVDYRDWDIIPALLLNSEVGKIVCDFNGKLIKIAKDLKKTKGLIVCEKKYFLQILRIINEIKK